MEIIEYGEWDILVEHMFFSQVLCEVFQKLYQACAMFKVVLVWNLHTTGGGVFQ